MGLLGGKCEGCEIRDDTISQLRGLLDEANRTALAVIDAKAYLIRYPAGKTPRAEPESPTGPLALSPADIRRNRYPTSTLSPEEIEATFAAEAAIRNRGEGAS